jgi:hypothetical protein
MAREAGGREVDKDDPQCCIGSMAFDEHDLKRFEALVRADEREACAKAVEEFARKWWKIHCDSNLHYSSTLKAHQDFCALQAAIRARENT